MRLNDLSPSKGAKKVGKRRGRGHSAGQGKTSGRGQKGQHARSGGYHKVGFEGGQMPLQRRLPKVGFNSRMDQGREKVNGYDAHWLLSTAGKHSERSRNLTYLYVSGDRGFVVSAGSVEQAFSEFEPLYRRICRSFHIE